MEQGASVLYHQSIALTQGLSEGSRAFPVLMPEAEVIRRQHDTRCCTVLQEVLKPVTNSPGPKNIITSVTTAMNSQPLDNSRAPASSC